MAGIESNCIPVTDGKDLDRLSIYDHQTKYENLSNNHETVPDTAV